jgi:DNA polymerase-4
VARPEATFLHADLDAFYASVEQLLDPALAGRPVVVGGTGPRGVVAAASYEARARGVHSAMPMARARRLCPAAVFLPPRMHEYERFSRAVMTLFRDVTPLVEPLSLDEAFLDVAGTRRTAGPPAAVARALRERVRAETGLAVSVGAASTKFLAKLASESAKPDGMLVVEPGTEADFLHPLPVSRLWGVGPATRRRLQSLGVATIGDLARLPPDALARAVGAAHGEHLHRLAHNRDDREVEVDRPVKSIGHEETFPVDLRDAAAIEREVLRLAQRVGARLRGAGLGARTVQVKVRLPDFRTVTRARTLPAPTDSDASVDREARALLEGIDTGGGIRLLGVSASGLVSLGLDPEQPALPFDGAAERGAAEPRRAVERAVDGIRARFGTDAVRPAALLPNRAEGEAP